MSATFAPRQSYIAPPCLEPMPVIYQDDDILLVHKPSGLLSVPGRLAQNNDSVATRALELHSSASIVHRLDMDTSGLMVLALNKAAHRHLSRQFETRQIDKIYHAIVSGKVSSHSGLIDLPIVCDWPNRPKQKICFSDGKRAQTFYRVLAYLHEAQHSSTRLELKPYTGRSHQLRIHMQTLGHPILGCKFYGTEHTTKQAPRLLLHAQSLGLTHPVSGERLNWCLDADF